MGSDVSVRIYITAFKQSWNMTNNRCWGRK